MSIYQFIIIFITYTPGTNKHTHEKNKIFNKKTIKKNIIEYNV